MIGSWMNVRWHIFLLISSILFGSSYTWADQYCMSCLTTPVTRAISGNAYYVECSRWRKHWLQTIGKTNWAFYYCNSFFNEDMSEPLDISFYDLKMAQVQLHGWQLDVHIRSDFSRSRQPLQKDSHYVVHKNVLIYAVNIIPWFSVEAHRNGPI